MEVALPDQHFFTPSSRRQIRPSWTNCPATFARRPTAVFSWSGKVVWNLLACFPGARACAIPHPTWQPPPQQSLPILETSALSWLSAQCSSLPSAGPRQAANFNRHYPRAME